MRSGAAIDFQKSELELEDPGPVCNACRLSRNGVRSIKRIVLEPSTWTGEDIFFARGVFAILVSEKFKAFCEEFEIKNAVMIPAAEYGFDFYSKKE